MFCKLTFYELVSLKHRSQVRSVAFYKPGAQKVNHMMTGVVVLP